MAAARPLLEHRVRVTPGQLPRRGERGDCARRHGERGGEGEHLAVDPHFAGTRKAGTECGNQHVDAVVGRGESRHAAADAEQQALGEQLLNHPSPSGAQRDANRNFPGAGVRADEHQVGKVGAGNEQDQRDRPEQDHQRGPGVGHEVVVQRHDQRAPVFVVGGVLEREAIGDSRQIGLGALDADARLELRDAAIVVIAADRAVFG